LDTFASDDEERYYYFLEEMDHRFFGAVKNFFKALNGDEAVLRLVEGENEYRFDSSALPSISSAGRLLT
jgi:hypothetical protein